VKTCDSILTRRSWAGKQYRDRLTRKGLQKIVRIVQIVRNLRSERQNQELCGRSSDDPRVVSDDLSWLGATDTNSESRVRLTRLNIEKESCVSQCAHIPQRPSYVCGTGPIGPTGPIAFARHQLKSAYGGRGRRKSATLRTRPHAPRAENAAGFGGWGVAMKSAFSTVPVVFHCI
jgi:hypothetical protein